MARTSTKSEVEFVVDVEHAAVEEAPSPAAAEDCLSYKPTNLSIITIIQEGVTSFTVRDGHHWITNYKTFTDAYNARQYMTKFNTICFTGRGTPRITYWFEKR
jgi:hypothetical protein